MSNREDYLSVLSKLSASSAVYVTNLNTTGEIWKRKNLKGSPSIYSMGMGLVTSVALGMALSNSNRLVVSIEGDGSLLIDLSVFSTVNRAGVRNLLIVCLDNKSYESIGGIPTHTAGFVDLVGIARSSGIADSYEVQDHSEFERIIQKNGLLQGKVSFINAIVKEADSPVPVSPPFGKLNKYEFLKLEKGSTTNPQ